MGKLKKLVTSNVPLKVVSCILGYTFWFILGHTQTIQTNLTVPLCFYGIPEHRKIDAPETITIELGGQRTILQSIDADQIAVHIDAQHFVEGSQPVEISQNSLFLPDSIKLIHYSPAQIIVTMLNDQPNIESAQT